MIKFFKRIRQRMIKENRFSRYMLYAIGEIVLVVIGIMIALQVNNLNEQNKAERLAVDYKIMVKSDLQRDTAFYKDYIRYMKEETVKWNRLKERVTSSNANLDTLIYINKNEFNFFLRTFQDFNLGAYNTIDAAGDWSVFTKAFTQDITALRVLQTEAKKQIELQFATYASSLNDHGKNYPGDKSFIMISNGPLNEYLWSHLNKTEYVKSFNGAATSRATYFRTTIAETQRLLNNTEDFLLTNFEK